MNLKSFNTILELLLLNQKQIKEDVVKVEKLGICIILLQTRAQVYWGPILQ